MKKRKRLCELEMLMRIKEELKEDDDKLTVCLENATQEEADCWCRTTVRQYGNTCVRIGSVGTLNL